MCLTFHGGRELVVVLLSCFSWFLNVYLSTIILKLKVTNAFFFSMFFGCPIPELYGHRIESVDPICRDSTDTQYISLKISTMVNFITMYHSSSSVSWQTTRPEVRKQDESTKPESFSSSSSSSPPWASSKLCDYGFRTKWQHFTLSRGALNWSLKNYGFICVAIFFSCTHAYKSLSNETWLLLNIAELEIQPILHTSTEEASEDRLAALW